ncbi:MAG TPA: hypothetical protein VK946_07460 [Methylotenera sp.]|nr:hypothetical protein [Methylotenera sp.]
MFTMTISLDSLAVYIVVADILILLSYVLYILHNKRRLEKSIKNITDFITDYFLNTGAEVQVTCFKVDGNRRYVTLIESQPLKRFRYSNVLESNLIGHVFKVTGNIVEKIYWRFPVQLNQNAMTANSITEENTSPEDDLYFADVHTLTESKAEYNVNEVSWDEFETSKKET